MRGTAVRLLIALLLGLFLALASAWALAAWMPLAMYPRQDSFDFIRGGRPWSAAQRARAGVWNIWWDEYTAAFVSPPPPPRALLRDSLRALAGVAPAANKDPALPTTAEGWMEYARLTRRDLRTMHPLRIHNSPPRWGTFGSVPPPAEDVRSGTDHGFGWPRPALWYRIHGVSAMNFATAWELEGGIPLTPRSTLELRGYGHRALPLYPHWPGLLTNTIAFALPLAALLIGPGVVRRSLRRRRGRCIRCGYSRAGTPTDAPCPECGASVGG